MEYAPTASNEAVEKVVFGAGASCPGRPGYTICP
jgi:hypothetical protein